MFTIVIKFIKTIFKIVITWIIIIEFFKIFIVAGRLGSNNIKLRGLKVHLNTKKKLDAQVSLYRSPDINKSS